MGSLKKCLVWTFKHLEISILSLIFALCAGYTNQKPIIVMDAGIATESNIEYLKDEKYDYVCVSRSNLKQYKADTDSGPVQIYDKKKQPVELFNVRVENDTDNYLWVKSEAKALKENSMYDQFASRSSTTQFHWQEKNPCGTLAKFEKLKDQIVSSLWMDSCNVG